MHWLLLVLLFLGGAVVGGVYEYLAYGNGPCDQPLPACPVPFMIVYGVLVVTGALVQPRLDAALPPLAAWLAGTLLLVAVECGLGILDDRLFERRGWVYTAAAEACFSVKSFVAAMLLTGALGLVSRRVRAAL